MVILSRQSCDAGAQPPLRPSSALFRVGTCPTFCSLWNAMHTDGAAELMIILKKIGAPEPPKNVLWSCTKQYAYHSYCTICSFESAELCNAEFQSLHLQSTSIIATSGSTQTCCTIDTKIAMQWHSDAEVEAIIWATWASSNSQAVWCKATASVSWKRSEIRALWAYWQSHSLRWPCLPPIRLCWWIILQKLFMRTWWHHSATTLQIVRYSRSGVGRR